MKDNLLNQACLHLDFRHSLNVIIPVIYSQTFDIMPTIHKYNDAKNIAGNFKVCVCFPFIFFRISLFLYLFLYYLEESVLYFIHTHVMADK